MKRDWLGSSRDENTNMRFADHDMLQRRIQFCKEEREIGPNQMEGSQNATFWAYTKSNVKDPNRTQGQLDTIPTN